MYNFNAYFGNNMNLFNPLKPITDWSNPNDIAKTLYPSIPNDINKTLDKPIVIPTKDYLFNMKKSIDMITDEEVKNKLMKLWYKLLPSIGDKHNDFLNGCMLGISMAINILLKKDEDDTITTMDMYIDSLD